MTVAEIAAAVMVVAMVKAAAAAAGKTAHKLDVPRWTFTTITMISLDRHHYETSDLRKVSKQNVNAQFLLCCRFLLFHRIVNEVDEKTVQEYHENDVGKNVKEQSKKDKKM